MKLFTSFALLQAATKLDARALDSASESSSSLLKRQVEHPGLAAPARVCGAIIGVAASSTVCASGASAAWDRIANNCDGSVGYQCVLDWIAYVGAHVAGVGFAGAGTAWAFGYSFGLGVAREAQNVALGARDFENHPTVQVSHLAKTGFTRILKPLNDSLPKLAAADVDKNLNFPFTFNKNGWANTYFPKGFEVDPTLLYHHVLPGANDTEAPSYIAQRFNDPGSLGLSKVSLAANPEPHQCVGGYKKSEALITMNPGYGLYGESVTVCGHPNRRTDATWITDLYHLYQSIPDFGKFHNKSVVESEIHNKASRYTFSNVRLVGETRGDFTSCFEGQHLSAYCSK